MKPKTDSVTTDHLFRSRLDQIINPGHELVRLADKIDWPLLENQLLPLSIRTACAAVGVSEICYRSHKQRN